MTVASAGSEEVSRTLTVAVGSRSSATENASVAPPSLVSSGPPATTRLPAVAGRSSSSLSTERETGASAW